MFSVFHRNFGNRGAVPISKYIPIFRQNHQYNQKPPRLPEFEYAKSAILLAGCYIILKIKPDNPPKGNMVSYPRAM